MQLNNRSFAVLIVGAVLSAVAGCSGSQSATESTVQAPPGVLAVVAGTPITVEEFERQYARTAQNREAAADDSPAEFREFLDRYVDYKLKVIKARSLGYPEDPSIREEIASYRGQLARPYLLGREVMDPLLQELYERRQTAVDISHVLLTVPEAAPAADTLAAYRRLTAIRDSVVAGADFGDMARRHSQDPSAKSEPGEIGSGGRLGYYGGGRLVKSFEDQAFNTPVGDISPVFRSQYGYHFLTVHGRIPMPPERRIAHIMIRPASPTAADSASAEQQLDIAVSRLESGEAFSDVARDLSVDRQSAANGGDIGFAPFDAGLPAAMREAAYGLDEIGDVSEPVASPYGMHIIKYLEERPLGSFDDEEERLRQTLQQLPRTAAAQDAYVDAAFADMSFTVDTSRIRDWTSRMEPDSLYRTLFMNGLPMAELNQPFATLEDSSYSVSDFTNWLGQNRTTSDEDPETRLLGAARQFLRSHVLEYQIATLEERDAEFRQTMAEFRDGLILFRLMEDSVWSAASSDTTGLRRLYETAQDTLRFEDRIRTISLSSPSDSVLRSVMDAIRSGSDLAAAVSRVRMDSTNTLRQDTSFVESPTGSMYDQVFDLSAGQITDPIEYQRGFLALYHGGIDPARAKTFEEARPELVGIHQEDIEADLIRRLRTEHGVRLFPERLDLVFSDLRATDMLDDESGSHP